MERKIKNRIIKDILLWTEKTTILTKYNISQKVYDEIIFSSKKLKTKIINWCTYVLCKHCRNLKKHTIDNFEKRSDNGHLRYVCRECSNTLKKVKRRQDSNYKIKARKLKRDYYHKNKDKILAYTKKYREENYSKVRMIEIKSRNKCKARDKALKEKKLLLLKQKIIQWLKHEVIDGV